RGERVGRGHVRNEVLLRESPEHPVEFSQAHRVLAPDEHLVARAIDLAHQPAPVLELVGGVEVEVDAGQGITLSLAPAGSWRATARAGHWRPCWPPTSRRCRRCRGAPSRSPWRSAT